MLSQQLHFPLHGVISCLFFHAPFTSNVHAGTQTLNQIRNSLRGWGEPYKGELLDLRCLFILTGFFKKRVLQLNMNMKLSYTEQSPLDIFTPTSLICSSTEPNHPQVC